MRESEFLEVGGLYGFEDENREAWSSVDTSAFAKNCEFGEKSFSFARKKRDFVTILVTSSL